MKSFSIENIKERIFDSATNALSSTGGIINAKKEGVIMI